MSPARSRSAPACLCCPFASLVPLLLSFFLVASVTSPTFAHTSLIFLAAQPRSDDFPRVSPFDAVRWPASDSPAVLIGDAWYTIISIDGLALDQVLAFVREEWGAHDTQRRFEEDLGEIMTGLGKQPHAAATLMLRDETGEEHRIDAPMSTEKRQRLRNARAGAEKQAMQGPYPEATVRALYADLAARLASSHAFTIIAPPDIRAQADSFQSTAHAATIAEIGTDITRLLARTGDGHASISLPLTRDTTRFLHCIIEPVGAVGPDPTTSRFIAMAPDRTTFIDAVHPYIVAIESRPIADLIAAASDFVVAGSPQLVRRRAARSLLTPTLFGLFPEPVPDKRFLMLTLANDAGAIVEREVRFDTSLPRLADWPVEGPPTHRMIETKAGPVGYLRISSMDDGDAFVSAVISAFDAFRAASCVATIIDVRGNGGGRRDLIDIIGPRLLATDAAPIVYNASRPVLLPDESEEARAGRMSSRYLFPADHSRWSDAERDAIAAFATSFKPTLAIPDGRFGPWHYAVLSPALETTPRPAGPTIVLLDAGCFSATDIFLAAMREIPGVILVGEPSSGGSGLTIPHVISSPDRTLLVPVRLSSMLSFQPDGRPFDGVGIHPDIEIPTLATDRLTAGTDSALDAAVRTIAGSVR